MHQLLGGVALLFHSLGGVLGTANHFLHSMDWVIFTKGHG
jgi:hypothetical protein